MLIAAAPSKVPFYIAGGLLAAWAVVIAFSGIRRPDFPSSKAGRRGVIVHEPAARARRRVDGGRHGGGGDRERGGRADVVGAPPGRRPVDGVPAFDRKTGTVKAGTVTIRFVNASTTEHNVAVAQGSRELGRSPTINGADTELKVDLRPGEYEYYCAVDGHRAAGMEGVLTVR